MPFGGASRLPAATRVKSTSTTLSPVLSSWGFTSSPLRSFGTAVDVAGTGPPVDAALCADAHPAAAIAATSAAVTGHVSLILGLRNCPSPPRSCGVVPGGNGGGAPACLDHRAQRLSGARRCARAARG